MLWAAPALAYAEPPFVISERSPVEELALENLPPSFYTFSPDEFWAEPRDSYWLIASNWVLTQERTQSDRVQALGEWADRTLSGSSQALPDNESYLRVGFATESEYGDPAQFEPEARFRLDIPTVEEKLRLVIESESDELIPLSERRRNRQLTEDERSDTEATGAFRYLSNVGDAINLSNDVGVRLRLPADAFWRATAEKQWQPGETWNLAVKQRVYYFHQQGWGSRSWFGAGRALGNGWNALLSSEMEWVHDERKFELSQTANFYKRLNNRSTLNPRVGVLGESQPNWRHTSVFADVTFRYRLHSDWLFGEVIPALEFPRDESFKDRGSLILRIELYFSGSIDRPY
ncbi:hypothetical protein NLU14_01645 [Marinobacter sp. 71-i]|uniref:DUF3187 domain-containing protein n=1 Tax=Marinobacter iranensis TaxID=2962607 RepID=A0ABT5Y702_9GAMM|nr:hypothetical protein [Marinobacter iranensis]MDF0748930.1 hypothetical protein [Marinobacter iranensis]